MTRSVIEVRDLGKRYRLRTGRAAYRTLRESLMGLFSRKPESLQTTNASQKQTAARPAENGAFWALKDLSFDVAEGEVLGVIGHNGAGKTTLLRLLSRITEPTTGGFRIRGRVGSLLEVGTGFHPELTGRENTFLSGAILGMTSREIAAKFDEIIDFAGVEKFIDMPVKHYSSGMYLRLAFAVAAHLEPEVLLVDEVLAVGDAAFQKKCLGKMQDVAGQGRTVLFVSHNMAAVSHLCERTLLLESGSMLVNGNTQSVIETYLAGSTRTSAGKTELCENSEKDAFFKSITLLDPSGNITAAHKLIDPITIVAKFTVRCPQPNLVCICEICASDGHVVLGTTEADWPNHRGQPPESLCKKEPGAYCAEFTLPAPLLNVGHYRIRFRLTRPRVKDFDVVSDLSLEVYDAGSFASTLVTGPRRGTLAMAIPWAVRFDANPDSTSLTSQSVV